MVDRICQKPVLDGKDVRVLAESFGEWLIEGTGTDSPALAILEHHIALKQSKLRLASPPEFKLLATRKYWAVNGLDVVLAVYGHRMGLELAREALQYQTGRYFADLFSTVVVVALEHLRQESKLPGPLRKENEEYLATALRRIAANNTRVARTIRELIDERPAYGTWTTKFRQRVIEPVKAFVASPDAMKVEFAPHALALLTITADAWSQLDEVLNRPLPSPVSAYIEATNSFNLDGFVAVFDDDALVNDHRDEFIGKERIRAWAAREIIGDHVTMKVVDQRVVGNHVALKAEIDGDFDKKGLPSPLVLAFYFCLSGSKISALVIVNNKTAT
jgi:hypothetical protein